MQLMSELRLDVGLNECRPGLFNSELVRHLKRQSYAVGKRIMVQGETPNSLMVLLKGEVLLLDEPIQIYNVDRNGLDANKILNNPGQVIGVTWLARYPDTNKVLLGPIDHSYYVNNTVFAL